MKLNTILILFWVFYVVYVVIILLIMIPHVKADSVFELRESSCGILEQIFIQDYYSGHKNDRLARYILQNCQKDTAVVKVERHFTGDLHGRP